MYAYIFMYIYIYDFIKVLLFFLFGNIKMVPSLPFFYPPPTHQHVLEVHPCQYIELFLILLDCCVVFHSLFNKVFPYR